MEIIPNKAKINKNSFLLRDKSAIAPNIGAIKTIMSPATELAVPNKAVEVASSNSPAQKDLKKRGKKPANTVVAKTEFAQSYRDQENFSLKVYLFVTVIL